MLNIQQDISLNLDLKHRKENNMGILGEVIRFVRDTIKDSLKECGSEELKEEIKDTIKALKGK